jgi:hypothetical protein
LKQQRFSIGTEAASVNENRSKTDKNPKLAAKSPKQSPEPALRVRVPFWPQGLI